MARLFDSVRSRWYVNWRGLIGADAVDFGAVSEDGEVDLILGERGEGEGGGGGGAAEVVAAVVAASADRHRVLVKGVAREMGVDSSRPVVDATGRKGIWRIMMF